MQYEGTVHFTSLRKPTVEHRNSISIRTATKHCLIEVMLTKERSYDSLQKSVKKTGKSCWGNLDSWKTALFVDRPLEDDFIVSTAWHHNFIHS